MRLEDVENLKGLYEWAKKNYPYNYVSMSFNFNKHSKQTTGIEKIEYSLYIDHVLTIDSNNAQELIRMVKKRLDLIPVNDHSTAIRELERFVNE